MSIPRKMSAHTQGQVLLPFVTTCEYESHQEECQARKPCNSGELELYTPCLWWTVRQHYHYSSWDQYQDIWTSIYYVLSPQSFWFKVHISPSSIGRNSTKARRKWLAIPWQKGGDGVFDRGSMVIRGEEARKRSCFYNCCVKFYCYCLKLWHFFFLSSVYIQYLWLISMLCSIVCVLLRYYLYVLSTSLLCPNRILYLRCKYFIYFALVECWTYNWSLGLSLTALRVRMSIYLLNVHCSHSLMTVSFWSRCAYMFSVFSNLIALFLFMYVPCV